MFLFEITETLYIDYKIKNRLDCKINTINAVWSIKYEKNNFAETSKDY